MRVVQERKKENEKTILVIQQKTLRTGPISSMKFSVFPSGAMSFIDSGLFQVIYLPSGIFYFFYIT